MKRSLFLLIAIIFSVLGSRAQVVVDARIDSIQILIGNQTQLHLSVMLKKGMKVAFPHYEPLQHLTPGVEVLGHKDDTFAVKGNKDVLRIERHFVLTSFDENLYAIPPLDVKVNGKTYSTKQLALKVITMDVDTLHPENFHPPKDVQNNPFSWDEWMPVFLLLFIVSLLLATSFFLNEKRRSAPKMVEANKPAIKLLPHQWAMQEIDGLKSEASANMLDQKTFYTSLTGILRQYIDQRFGFRAMEMTSCELIEKLRQEERKTMIEDLAELLDTADMVKFAKFTTDESNLHLQSAVDYVEQTKQEGELPHTMDTRHHETVANPVRKKLLMAISTIAIIIMALLGIVAHRLIELL